MIRNKYKLPKSFLLGLSAFAVVLSGCMHHSEHDEPQKPLNIDYKAAYVINGQDNNVSVLKLQENRVAETIKLQEAVAPHHIALSPDKKHLAIAITSTDLSGGHGGHGGSTGGYKVMILDAVSGMEVKVLSTPDMPHNAAYNQAGSELWVGQAGGNKVLVFDTKSWSVKSTVAVGKSPSEVTFSTNGALAFVANTDDATVTVIDQTTKAVKKTIPVGAEPVGAWPAANGKMYVDNEAGQTVSVIDVNSLTVEETIALNFKPGYVAYHSGTNELWVSNATDGKVVIYRRDGNSWQRKTEVATGADAHAIIFDEDMKLAYVTNQGAHNVSVINTVDYSKVTTLSVGRKPNGMVIR
ncbi:YncE family protein [Pontibacter ruber]|uniref:YncE family protein n=1 Tax=Pontibacter ruber TaxID=1343895 RepID=A0ABW5CZB4_9BACT|nr:YncE family protein [Pontibacter ruber]